MFKNVFPKDFLKLFPSSSSEFCSSEMLNLMGGMLGRYIYMYKMEIIAAV